MLQNEKVLVLMYMESFFTVNQDLDWQFFSDAEGTFSQLIPSLNINKAMMSVFLMQSRRLYR